MSGAFFSAAREAFFAFSFFLESEGAEGNLHPLSPFTPSAMRMRLTKRIPERVRGLSWERRDLTTYPSRYPKNQAMSTGLLVFSFPFLVFLFP